MKITDSDIRKIERLADAWEVQMPAESFFVNLPAKVMVQVREKPRPWWFRLPVPAGAAALMAVIAVAGFFIAGRDAARSRHLAKAAVEWDAEGRDWENLDRVLAEAQDAGVSDLHRYLDAAGLESAASTLDRYPSDEEDALLLALGQ